MNKNKFYPWKLFKKFFITFFIVFNLFQFISLFFIIIFFQVNLSYQQIYLYLFIFICFSFLISIFFAHRFALPLRRVFLKALRMANKKLFYEVSSQEMSDEALFESEPGEYFELEQALNQIQKKMKKRRIQLDHEREESKALLSTIEDAVVTIGLDSKILHSNSSFEDHFLSHNISSKMAEPFFITQIFRDTDLINMFDQAIKLDQSVTTQKQLNTFAGGLRIFSITVNPLHDLKTKEVYAALGIFHDLTDLKRSEKVRIDFVENASHELRTPLTSIKGYLETLRQDFESGQHEHILKFLNVVTRNVDQLNDLMNDLLAISSLEHGMPLDIEIVSTDDLSRSVILKFQELALKKNIEIKYFNDGASFVFADPMGLEQVLENLLANALRYGNQNGFIQIHWIKIEMMDHVCKKFQLKVIDNGPGISEEHLPRIFERFYRVDRARSRDLGGTGLGLAIVKHIVQSHGGEVTVQSDLGKGTEFCCLFNSKLEFKK